MDHPVSASGCAQTTPAAIADSIRDLPLSIRVLPKLKKLLRDGDSCMQSIVGFLRLDPGLATRVLRMGNSAYFSGCYRCQSLEEAVARIGYQQIYETIAFAVASEVLVRPVPAYNLEADQLWQRSVTCALAAEALATKCSVDKSDAYTTGLLHNIGMVAIDRWMNLNHPDVVFAVQDFPFEWTAAERDHLGFTHADVGETLLTHWEFPLETTVPVKWQYAPRAASSHQLLVAILYVARWIRTTLCQPSSTPLPPDKSLMSKIGITGSDLPDIIDEVQIAMQKVEAMLETDQPKLKELPFPARS